MVGMEGKVGDNPKERKKRRSSSPFLCALYWERCVIKKVKLSGLQDKKG